MSLKDQKILVAGAGGLLGRSLVSALLKEEASVIAADIKLDTLKLYEKEWQSISTKSNLSICSLDMTQAHSVSNFFSNNFGISGAVNCCYPRNENYGNHFFDVELNDFNENVSMNLGSSFIFMKECALYFKHHKTPFSLVNISSIYGVIPPKFEIYKNTDMTMPVEYAAIKSGLIHLSKYAVKYVADTSFRVNVVSPGGIFDGQSEVFLSAYKDRTFGSGMLNADDMVGSIIFLLSPKSKFVTGQNIIIDDGFSL